MICYLCVRDGSDVLSAVMVAFLKANGRLLDVAEAEAAVVMQRVAAGTMNDKKREAWLLKWTRPL